VLTETFPWLLLAVAQLPLLAGVHVGALEVADKDPTHLGLVVILSRGKCSSQVCVESTR
jgi:hypothetical protein